MKKKTNINSGYLQSMFPSSMIQSFFYWQFFLSIFKVSKEWQMLSFISRMLIGNLAHHDWLNELFHNDVKIVNEHFKMKLIVMSGHAYLRFIVVEKTHASSISYLVLRGLWDYLTSYISFTYISLISLIIQNAENYLVFSLWC